MIKEITIGKTPDWYSDAHDAALEYELELLYGNCVEVTYAYSGHNYLHVFDVYGFEIEKKELNLSSVFETVREEI